MQLTKANSIEGCKKASVAMNYTWATNLKKTQDMETGAVSYKNNKLVVKLFCEKDKDIVRATMKTKTEEFPDFEKEYQSYLYDLQKKENAVKQAEKKKQQEEEKAGRDAKNAKQKEWEDFFEHQDKDEKKMMGGHNQFLEDDFM